MPQRPAVIAVYAGTFDPVTHGHADIIRRACALFDRVLVAVAVAHHKKTLFSLPERLDLVHRCIAADSACANAHALPFDGLLTEFAQAHGAQVLVRGLRSATDFDYENQLAGMNARLRPHIHTVFLPPAADLQHISSTLVREIALLGGDAAQFVAPHVWQALLAARHARTGADAGASASASASASAGADAGGTPA